MIPFIRAEKTRERVCIAAAINRKEFFMKKFKKALIGITSLVMAFSMTAICACTGGNQSGNQGDTPGGIAGDDNNPGGSHGGEQGGNTEQPKSDAQKIIEAFQKQNIKAVGIEYSFESTEEYTGYASEADGTKLGNAITTVNCWHNVFSGTQRINIQDLEIDASDYNLTEELDKDGNVVADSESNREGYSYSFIRGGYEFYTNSEVEITDFSKVTFEGGNSMEMPEQLSAMLAQLPESGATGDMLAPVAAILNLADIYGGATFADKKLTVDLNKVAYKLYTEVLAEIDALDENTTVAELIAAKPVKNLLQSLTYGVDAKKIVDELKKNFTSGENKTESLAEEGNGEQAAAMAMVAELVKVLPDAEEGESVYDYLVKTLNSKDFGAAVIGLLTGSPVDVPVALGDFKVMQIVSLVTKITTPPTTPPDPGYDYQSGGVSAQAEDAQPEMTMEQVKELIKGYLNMVTVTEDKVTVATGESSDTELSALKLVLAVGDDYTVSSVSFSGNMKTTYSSVDKTFEVTDGETGEVTVCYTASKGSETSTITAEIKLSEDEYSLTDINGNKVTYTEYELQDQIGYAYCGRIYDNAEGAEKSLYDVYVGLDIEGGQVVDVNAYLSVWDETTHQNTHVLIESSEFDGTSVSFTIEGIATCEYVVEWSYEYGDKGDLYINVEQGDCNAIGAEVSLYELFLYNGNSVSARRISLENTVSEIIK